MALIEEDHEKDLKNEVREMKLKFLKTYKDVNSELKTLKRLTCKNFASVRSFTRAVFIPLFGQHLCPKNPQQSSKNFMKYYTNCKK